MIEANCAVCHQVLCESEKTFCENCKPNQNDYILSCPDCFYVMLIKFLSDIKTIQCNCCSSSFFMERFEIKNFDNRNYLIFNRETPKEEIKPCPKCKSKDLAAGAVGRIGTKTEHYIKCNSCEYKISTLVNHAECVRYWNMEQKKDDINHPSHYTSHPSGVECVKIAEHYNFNVGSAFKYLWRCGLKGEETKIKDLQKAKKFINFEIERVENFEKK